MTRKVPFGRQMRDAYFGFSPSYTPLNHGSFGTAPLPVIAHQRAFDTLATERPDTFIVFDLPRLIDESRNAVTPLLGVPVDEVVFVPNATTGINTVLRNLKFDEGDVIVHFSTIYDACEKTVASVGELEPLTRRCIEIEYPIEDEEIVRRFREMVKTVRDEGKNVKIAMFDTVLTFPGARMPWEELTMACKELGVLSLIDGAHGIGHIDLTHLGKVGPDFFVSNCHKWLFTPRGCAIFHVPLRNQHLIHTSIPTSHGYSYTSSPPPPSVDGKSHFVLLFEFVATIDYTPYLVVPAAIAFRNEVCGGEAAIWSYCYSLARGGGDIVASILGTERMDNKTHTLTQCSFANIRLPIPFTSPTTTSSSSTNPTPIIFTPKKATAIAVWLNRTAVDEHDTYLQIAFHGNVLWVRLSAQVYIGKEDFEWIGHVLVGLCARVRGGEVVF
ncbi:hypothetical protein G7Y89_g5897 [Cudoniella acicularis]|uniref:Aminotransferase class V domain-containing protein n=1 Tax=Cudoniella acicularis TaxID=354080 RepID=A0A8H4RNS0_9HELO|nr:hypothetical protein G7Y89_g5897 [Cudoniella acicularis]